VLDLDLPAVPASALRIRRELRDILRRVAGDLIAVELAVTEAVANAVVHAYRERPVDQEVGRVRVTVTLDSDSLCVSVTDAGIGMSPRVDSPGAGLGLPLIARLASQIEIDPRAGGTRLRMWFPLAPVV
jgi:serine/threonine-protein kinase RsbW/stage II sporulation protein AB (anti-sigma F factor)